MPASRWNAQVALSIPNFWEQLFIFWAIFLAAFGEI